MTSRNRTAFEAVLLVAVITFLWILLAPPSSGPDEPGHQVRGAALVRGQLDGEALTGPSSQRGFEIPAWVGFPDPSCYQFKQDVPVNCATSIDRPDGEALLGTRAADYQIWGHLLPGVGSFAPPSVAGTAARLLDAVIPVVLVGLSVAAMTRRGWLATASVLLAVTPLAWFMFAVVNPSGTVIAGGIALWVGLTAGAGQTGRLSRWLIAVGWAAMVLPRRDGLVWAALSLALAILITDQGLRDWWRRLGIGPQVLIVVSTLATLAWASTSDTNAAAALFVAPLAPLAAAAGRTVWRSPALNSPARRWMAAGVVALVGLAGMLAVMSLRTSGLDRAVLRRIIDRTGGDLTEAIGILGWLDVNIPTSFLYLWVIALGLLVAATLVDGDRAAMAGAIAILGTAVLSSWTLSMLQNEPTGVYWQGRYYLPLLVGLPITLGRARIAPEAARRLARATIAIALIVLNAALVTAVRRWAVGFSGPLLPWQWNTYDTVVPPMVLLAGHAFASWALWAWIGRRIPGQVRLQTTPLDDRITA